MFEYFPRNYPWSLAVMGALNRGGEIGEIDDACRPLQEASVRNDDAAQVEWYANWKKIAERVESLARAHEAAGQGLSAGRKYLRAGVYFITAERMLNHRDPKKVEVYKQALAAFGKGYRLRKEPVEWVEVPFQGKSMPALFTKPSLPGPLPCMIHFDGFDVMKEIIYQIVADDFRRRGIAVLFVDHPGVGEALRLRGMTGGHDTEVPAAACVDYLETRSDVDPKRIGIAALSLGGYYAPRAAAFEKRLACCVAWNGIWDQGEKVIRRLGLDKGRRGEVSVPQYADQLMWVFGRQTVEEAADVAKKMTMEGIADKITCPLLVMQGANDRQTPPWQAERLYAEAVNSPRKKLKMFTVEEGGAEHCQADNASLASDCMTDWVAEVLGGNPNGI
jgi:dienelactone hydrolase